MGTLALRGTLAQIITLVIMVQSTKGSVPSLGINSILPLRGNLKNLQRGLPSDMSGIMNSIGRRDPSHHIRILYDLEHKDRLADISEQLSNNLFGLMSLTYEGPESDLQSMLNVQSRKEATYLFLWCSPKTVMEIFEKINNDSLKSHRQKWLIVTESKTERDEVISSLEMLVYEGTQVTILAKESNHIFNVYSDAVNVRGNVRFYLEGRWDLRSKIERNRMWQLIAPDDHRSLRYDLSGREMIVAAKEALTYFSFGRIYSDGSVDPEAGLEVQILKSLSAKFNFTCIVKPSKDNLYGNPQPDGSVNGIVGMVARREAAFAISLLAITGVRKTVVDFTSSYYYAALQLASRAPKQKNRALAVLMTFKFVVWMAILANVLIMGYIMYLQSKLMNILELKIGEQDIQSHLFNTFRSLVIQGNLLSDDYWTRKILLVTWFLFCLIFSALYSGMLTAVLIRPANELPIDTLRDLPRAIKDGYTLGVLKQSANEYVFRGAPPGIFKDTWALFNHKDPEQSFVDGFGTGMKRVLERKYVFVVPDNFADLYARQFGRKNFYFGSEKFAQLQAGVACQPGSPFEERFSIALMRMVEGGLVLNWVERERSKIKQIVSSASNVDDPLNPPAISIIHVQAAFFVNILGFFVAFLVLIFENVFHFGLCW